MDAADDEFYKKSRKDFFCAGGPKITGQPRFNPCLKYNVQVSSKILYQAYSNWCENSGEFQLKQNWFGRKLREKGFENKVLGSKRARYWQGLDLMDKDLVE